MKSNWKISRTKAWHQPLWLNLDDSGSVLSLRPRPEVRTSGLYEELAQLEAALAEPGESLESTYDEHCIVRKRYALRTAGLHSNASKLRLNTCL